MKEFMKKIKREGKLELVGCSENIRESYETKCKNCIKAAMILSKERLFENSVTQSYYAIYNAVLALLFACGIKSENHTVSIALLEFAFDKPELSKRILKAKKERINKQYYLTEDSEEVTDQIAKEMISLAEKAINEIRLLTQDLTEKHKDLARKVVSEL